MQARERPIQGEGFLSEKERYSRVCVLVYARYTEGASTLGFCTLLQITV